MFVWALGGYDLPMESHSETESERAAMHSPRTFPAWVQLSAIGVMAILTCAVIAGMFLY